MKASEKKKKTLAEIKAKAISDFPAFAKDVNSSCELLAQSLALNSDLVDRNRLTVGLATVCAPERCNELVLIERASVNQPNRK